MPVGCRVHLGVAAIASLLFRGEEGSGSPPDARPPDRLSKDTGSVCVPVVEWPMPKSCGKHTPMNIIEVDGAASTKRNEE